MGATETFIPAPRSWQGTALAGNGMTGGEGAHFDRKDAADLAEAHARQDSETAAMTRFIKLFERGDPQAQIEVPLAAGKAEAVSGRIYESLAHPRLGEMWGAELLEILSACMRSGDERLRNKARALVAHMALEYASDCTVARG